MQTTWADEATQPTAPVKTVQPQLPVATDEPTGVESVSYDTTTAQGEPNNPKNAREVVERGVVNVANPQTATDTEHVTPVDEQQTAPEGKKLSYVEMFQQMSPYKPPTPEELEKERKNLLFTGQFHGDIWGGMALSMGLMGAGKYTLSGIAYGSMKHQVNKADRKAAEIFTPERWEPIREIIDSTTNDDMGALAESMVNDPNLSDEERTAVLGYMERSLNLRGLNLGAMAQSRGVEDEEGAEMTPSIEMEIDSELSQSYIDGYEASSPQEMNDAQNMFEYQRQRVEGMFDPSVLESLDGNPIATLMDMSQTGLYSQEEIDAARDYINAKTVRDGILQRVNDNIDEQIAQSDAMINGRVNRQTGMIQPAVMTIQKLLHQYHFGVMITQ